MTRRYLRFDRPARAWLEALPLGNGRLGAMVFGDPWSERIALNDSTLWSGSPLREEEAAVGRETAAVALYEARAAVLERRFAAATAAVQRLQGSHSQTFLPLGDLRLDISLVDGRRPAVRDYRRQLDLATGIHTSSFEIADEGYVRWEACISHPDGVLQLHLHSDVEVNVRVRWESQLQDLAGDDVAAAMPLVRRLRAPGDVPPPHEPELSVEWAGESTCVAVVLDWRHDGTRDRYGALRVRDLTLCLAAQTTFAGFGHRPGNDVNQAELAAAGRVAAALDAGNRTVADRHRADHAALFDRVDLTLDTADDVAIDEILFHYGRYLLIAASRRGGAPATLQGLWNERMRPPWSSNYTVNINTQMNYWAAGPAALAETAEPLLELIEAMTIRGAETAERLYAARGWVAHHNTDIWAYTSPVGRGTASPAWAFWPMGGAWLSLTFAELLGFGADDELAQRAYPVLRGAMQFVLDWVIDIDGLPTTVPSTSPENAFRTAEGVFSVGRSSTMDLSLAAELGAALGKVAARIGREGDEVVVDARRLIERLPSVGPGRDGLVPEWADDDPDAEPHHRHISHLFSLYPGSALRDDSARAAASASLDARGDESTGWSLVWKIAARARLRDRDAVGRLLALMFRPAPDEESGQRGGLYPNLFAAHPPFQIDGNLGYVAAVCECLVQSHDDVVELLPAIPERWPAGEVRGLIARPGIRVDVSWDLRGLRRVTLDATVPCSSGPVAVRWGEAVISVDLSVGVVTLYPHDFVQDHSHSEVREDNAL